MAHSEGLVTVLYEDGRAQVVIQPQSPGILGAPHLDVCHHCPTDSSKVVVDARNQADAGVGDWVSLDHGSGSRLKNALLLILPPFIGTLLGACLAVLMDQTARITHMLLITGITFLIGICAGIFMYRIKGEEVEMIVTRTIQKAEELASPAGLPETDSEGGALSQEAICNACRMK